MSTREEWIAMAEHAEMHIRLAKAVHGQDCRTGYQDEAKYCRAKAEAMVEEKTKHEHIVSTPSWSRDATDLVYSGKMPIATVLATIASWVKWLLKENGMIEDLATKNCPLCERFVGAIPSNWCMRGGERCPLFVHQNQCADTPYARTTRDVVTASDCAMRLHIEAKIPVEFKPLLDGIQYAIRNAKVEPKPAQERVTYEQVHDWINKTGMISQIVLDEIRCAFGKV